MTFLPSGMHHYTVMTGAGSRMIFPAKDDAEAIERLNRPAWRGMTHPLKLYRGDISIADAKNHTPIREIG